MSKTDQDAIDRDALERCLAAARAEDAGRARQLDSMLRDRPWESVATFACRCAQSKSFGLMPWQDVPFRARLSDLDKPFDDPRGQREAAEILRRLLDNNLSAFEPDPLRAIAEAEQRQTATR